MSKFMTGSQMAAAAKRSLIVASMLAPAKTKRQRRIKKEANDSVLGSDRDGRGEYDQDGNRWVQKMPGC